MAALVDVMGALVDVMGALVDVLGALVDVMDALVDVMGALVDVMGSGGCNGMDVMDALVDVMGWKILKDLFWRPENGIFTESSSVLEDGLLGLSRFHPGNWESVSVLFFVLSLRPRSCCVVFEVGSRLRPGILRPVSVLSSVHELRPPSWGRERQNKAETLADGFAAKNHGDNSKPLLAPSYSVLASSYSVLAPSYSVLKTDSMALPPGENDRHGTGGLREPMLKARVHVTSPEPTGQQRMLGTYEKWSSARGAARQLGLGSRRRAAPKAP
eukprot:gene9986-biopygen2546